MTHTEGFPFFGRSAFLVFIRVPGGREVTINFLHKMNKEHPLTVPTGTEVALVRRMMLIDDTGEITLSPIVESIQVRHFVSNAMQKFHELRLNRTLLFSDSNGGLLPADNEIALFFSHEDGFQSGHGPEEAEIPDRCTGCHIDEGLRITGVRSILSFSRQRFPLPKGQQPLLVETTIEREAQNVILWKLKHQTWNSLKALWYREVP